MLLHKKLCLKPILCNIVESNGANDFVEVKRGKEDKKIKMEDIIKLIQKRGRYHSNNLTKLG